jgi:hypothetical protein
MTLRAHLDVGATFGPPKSLFKTQMLTGVIQSGIEYDALAEVVSGEVSRRVIGACLQ